MTLDTLPLVDEPVVGPRDLEQTVYEQALAWRLSAALKEGMHPRVALALLDAWPALQSDG